MPVVCKQLWINEIQMMSQVAEIIIFILLGVTCVEGLIHSISWNTALFFVTLLCITVFRFLSVFLLTFILNFTRKEIAFKGENGDRSGFFNFRIAPFQNSPITRHLCLPIPALVYNDFVATL